MEKMYAGARIRTLRRAEGLTQTEMAKHIGLSTSYLNQLENDARPLTVTALMAFVRAFNVDVSYFAPDSNSRMVADLKDIMTLAGTSEVDDAELVEFAERHPEIARGMLRLTHRQHKIDTTDATSPATTPDPQRSSRRVGRHSPASTVRATTASSTPSLARTRPTYAASTAQAHPSAASASTPRQRKGQEGEAALRVGGLARGTDTRLA